jgi:hypothetical protein
MSDKIKLLQEIEARFAIESIRCNGEPFWPVLRSFFYNQAMDDVLLKHSKSRFLSLRKIRNVFFGFGNWFQRKEYIVLSNEMERKKLGDFYIDKLTEGFIQLKGKDKVLYIEQVKDSHLDYQAYNKDMVSLDTLILMAGIYMKIFNPQRRIKIEGEAVIRAIAEQYAFDINYESSLNIFLSKTIAFEWVLKSIKPKALIITDYGYFWATYAAKKAGIKVVEFQHGVIGNSHPYYHPAKKMNPRFCPDYLLVFGEADKEALSHGNYVPAKQVIPIGNFYIGQLAQKQPNPEILGLISNYHYSVCVPTDPITHTGILNFIKVLAAKLTNCIFLIAPRNLSEVEESLLPNLRLVKQYPFQELVRHCDFHTATNSTCCLEALALGAKNILLDNDGLASQYYEKVLTDRRFTVFVTSIDEYEQYLLKMKDIPRQETIESNRAIYMPNHELNLIRFVEAARI